MSFSGCYALSGNTFTCYLVIGGVTGNTSAEACPPGTRLAIINDEAESGFVQDLLRGDVLNVVLSCL